MKCTVCNKGEANQDSVLGVLPCDDCQERRNRSRTPLHPSKRSMQSKLEYAATPFWKHMGLKPKPHEVAFDKERKRRGMSHRDVVLANRQGGNFSADSIKNNLQKGNLKGDKKAIGYGSSRASGTTTKKTS